MSERFRNGLGYGSWALEYTEEAANLTRVSRFSSFNIEAFLAWALSCSQLDDFGT
ncbi:MAG: hypothetical protein WCR71_05600 [Bacteroidales bacterium]